MPNDFLAPILTKVPQRAPKGASVEYGRLVRAIGIIRAGQQENKPTIERRGVSEFLVKGNDQPFYAVDLSADQRCYCKDAEFSPFYDRMCKHEISCRLVNREPGMLAHMVEVIAREEARKEQAA